MTFLSSLRRAACVGAFLLALSALPAQAATFTVTTLNDDGVGSLRQAVQSANAKADADTITFKSDSKGILTFTAGEIVISHDIIISGPTSRAITLKGNGSSRLFTVRSGTVSMSNLTLTGGKLVGATGRPGTGVYGGALYNAGTLSLSDVTFAGNSIVGGDGSAGFGDDQLAIPGGQGGEARGGAIFNAGTLTLRGVALQNNSAQGGAGGKRSRRGREGSGGNALGGALYNGGKLAQGNVTYSGNAAIAGSGSPEGFAVGPNFRDVLPVAYNATVKGVQGDAINVQLAAKGDLLTYSLVSGTLPDGLTLSSSGLISGTPTQTTKNGKVTYRASDRYRTSNTATLTFNVEPSEPPSLVVTTLSDDSTHTDGLISLREALSYANSLDEEQTITFKLPPSAGSTLTLTQGPLTTAYRYMHRSDTVIDWTGPGLLTIRSDGASIFSIDSILSVNRLKITGTRGYRAMSIEYHGVLIMTNCLVTGNLGGAIYSRGSVSIDSSTLSYNSSDKGGAIYNYSGDVSLHNTTLCDNSATDDGGAIYNESELSLDNCTLTANSADSSTGRGSISSTSGLSLANCLIAGNTGNKGQHLDDLSGDSNLDTDNCILRGSAKAAGLQTDQNGLPLLKDNGGPTPTVALVAGSPAINTGGPGLQFTEFDQRGITRPQGSAPDIGAYERQSAVPVLSINDVSVREGNSGTTPMTFTLALNKASTSSVKVFVQSFKNTALANEDYMPLGQTLVTFAPGQTHQTVTILIKGDIVVEGDERLALQLFSPTGAELGTSTGIGTIANDDRAPKSLSFVGSSSNS